MISLVKPGSQNARILWALSDGRWHSVASIHRRAGTSRLNSRVSELRKRHGYVIEHAKTDGRGALAHRYRLLNPPAPQELERLVVVPKPAVSLARDEVPRDTAHRFRIYCMAFDELELVGTAENEEGIGRTLLALGRKGVFGQSCVGLLDTYGSEEVRGTWVINPWDTVPIP